MCNNLLECYNNKQPKPSVFFVLYFGKVYFTKSTFLSDSLLSFSRRSLFLYFFHIHILSRATLYLRDSSIERENDIFAEAIDSLLETNGFVSYIFGIL